MNGFIILLAVLGMVWLYVSFTKWMKAVKQAWNNDKVSTTQRIKDTASVAKNNRFGKDLRISLIFVALGGLVLAGVTGMVIGLLASTMISFFIWISSKSKAVQKVTGL